MKSWSYKAFKRKFDEGFRKKPHLKEDSINALEEKYFCELVSQAESVEGQFEEYVEHLRASVDDCIKKFCVLNDLFERKMAKKMSVIMQVLGDKLVERFKELELEREKQEKRMKKEAKKHERR
jgi:hypothetical protein